MTVTEFKTIYGADLDTGLFSDTTISGMISGASRQVDQFTSALKGWDNEALVGDEHSSHTHCHTDADGNLVIALRKRPLFNNSVDSVTNLTIALGAFTTSLTLTNNGSSVLHCPPPYGLLTYPSSFLIAVGTLLGAQRLNNLRSYHYFVRLSYQAGYVTIPDDMKYATSLYVREAMSRRYNPAGAVDLQQGSMRLRFAVGANEVSPLVKEARAILQPYVMVA